jgi:CubicO group peptidase (beta-lactamase class C family)
MSSGLQWSEVYDFFNTDVVPMLYGENSAASRQVGKPLAHKPGEHWYYSSGSSNALSMILQRSFDRIDQYLTFPREELFESAWIWGILKSG